MMKTVSEIFHSYRGFGLQLDAKGLSWVKNSKHHWNIRIHNINYLIISTWTLKVNFFVSRHFSELNVLECLHFPLAVSEWEFFLYRLLFCCFAQCSLCLENFFVQQYNAFKRHKFTWRKTFRLLKIFSHSSRQTRQKMNSLGIIKFNYFNVENIRSTNHKLFAFFCYLKWWKQAAV